MSDLDKYEYRVRAEEINALIEHREYGEAVKIADTIDWQRVKSVTMLCKVSELYKMNRRYEESRDILLLAYERQPGARKIVYSLCELAIKLDDVVLAVEYYKEFVQVAPRDTGKYILQYRLYEAQDVSLEERIAVLEEYKKRDYREKWAYELAYLYHRIGLATKCVEECDELILWFGDGKYVIKALELKMIHEPLTESQLEKYNRRNEKSKQQEEQSNIATMEVKVDEEIAKVAQEVEMTLASAAAEIISESSESEGLSELVEPEELEIEVKAIDMGEYNTINLQEELAKNLAQVMAAEDMIATDATVALPIDTIVGEATKELMVEAITAGAITDEVLRDAIMSPLLQDTVELTPVMSVQEPEDEAEELEELEELEEEIQIEEEIIKDIFESEEELVEKEQQDNLKEDIYWDEDDLDAPEELLEAGKVQFHETKDLNPIFPKRVMPITSVIPIVPGLSTEPIPDIRVIEGVHTSATILEEQMARIAEQLAKLESKVVKVNETVEEVVNKTTEAERVSENTEQEETEVERQITGQLSMEDIMAEWEQTKKEVEEKRIEEMRRKLIAQTGPMFQNYDAQNHIEFDYLKPSIDVFAKKEEEVEQNELDKMNFPSSILNTSELKEIEEELVNRFEEQKTQNGKKDSLSEREKKAGLLDTENLADLVAQVLEETGYKQENIVEEVSEDVVSDVNLDTVQLETVLTNEDGWKRWPVVDVLPSQDQAEEKVEQVLREVEEVQEAAAADEVIVEKKKELTPMEAAVLKLKARTIAEEEMKKASVALDQTTKISLNTQELDQISFEQQDVSTRTLTKAEKEVFGCIAQTKEMQEQVAHALDTISLIPYTGNVLLSGNKGTGTITVAKNIIKELQQTNPSFSGKVAKVTGSLLDKKDIHATLEGLENGALIVEQAGDLSDHVVERILKDLNTMQDRGIIIIFEDTKSKIEKLIQESDRLLRFFPARIDLLALDNNGLVNFGKEYAKELEYSIDEMGMLALYTRITDMQTSDHCVTVDEVKEMVDEAIRNAEKKSVSKFMDVLLAKRYDEDDLIVLREKDFIHN